MTANDCKSDFSYSNKLVDQYNHHSVDKILINHDYSALNEYIELSHKPSKFKINDRVKLTKYKKIFTKCYPKNSL